MVQLFESLLGLVILDKCRHVWYSHLHVWNDLIKQAGS